MLNWLKRKLIDSEIKRLNVGQWDVIVVRGNDERKAAAMANTIMQSKALPGIPIVVCPEDLDIDTLRAMPEDFKHRLIVGMGVEGANIGQE